jgi:hypothetical protein
MDFSEFLRRIGAEPRSEDAELRAARTADPRCAAAATEAERFEDRLEQALRLPVAGERLAEELLDTTFATDRPGIEAEAAGPSPKRADTQEQDRGLGPRRPWPWLAIAAALVLTVGVVNVLNTGPGANAGTVEEYVRDHFRHDGPELLARVDQGLRGDDAAKILAALGAQAGKDLAARIEFIKFCPTLYGRGAHMVVRGSGGLVTVIFMPDTKLERPRQVRFDDMAAELLALGSGSVAIIGPEEQDETELAGLLLASIQPLPQHLPQELSGGSGDA